MGVSLSEIKARVLDSADMTSSGFIVDARLTDYINEAISKLYDEIVTTYEDYFTTKTTITVTAGTSRYSLPDNFYKSRGVFVIDGTNRYRLMRFNLRDYDQQPYYSELRHFRYKIMNNYLYLSPDDGVPSGSLELWYTPKMNKVVNDDDVIDFVISNNGWEQYIVLDAAIKCLRREESDPTMHMAEQADVLNRILTSLQSRDSEPGQIADVYNYDANFYDVLL